jgi:ATP phosphoribosyltransferase regulatory subunit
MPESPYGSLGAALPGGGRDVLPVEAEELRSIEHQLGVTTASFGYREVRTPVLELADVLDRAQEGGLGRTFRLFDDDGRTVVLRPDLTIPISRLIATRMADEQGPLRVRYTAPRFRRMEPGRPTPTEERQSGVELVGINGPESDAEVIALLVKALRATGLVDVQVAIGDAELGARVLDALAVPEAARRALTAAAADHNLVTWRRIVTGLGLSPQASDFLVGFPGTRGDRSVLAPVRRLAPGAAGACDWLEATLDLLDGYGVGEAVRIDFGVLRDWSYYSGVVFEAYASGESTPVAVGGRYDTLAARFGSSRPSVGFAVSLGVLHRALGTRGRFAANALRDGVVVAEGLREGLLVAEAIRASGITAIAVPGGIRDAESTACAQSWRFVASVRGGEVEISDRSTGRSESGEDAVVVLRALLGDTK